MADKKYYKALKRDDKIFQFVNTFWELMKLCDDPEIREMYQMLYKAFDKHDGKAEDVREIWTYWWVLFQSYYNSEKSEQYWEELHDSAIAFYEKYHDSDKEELVLGLATMVCDWNQWRMYEQLL